MPNRMVIAFSGMVLMLPGCSDRGPQLPRAPVSGVVRYEGAPLERGTVIFFHESTGNTATGRIGPDGRYSLDAFVGHNRIVVRSHASDCKCLYCEEDRALEAEVAEMAHREGKSPDDDKVRSAAMARVHAALANSRAGTMILPTPFVPERYENHMISGLQADVREAVENTADFELAR